MINFHDYDSIFDRNKYPIFKIDNEIFKIDLLKSPCLCLSGKRFQSCCQDKVEEAFKLSKDEKNKRLEQLYQFELYKKDLKQPPKSDSVKFEKKARVEKAVEYCSAQKIYPKECEQLIKNAHTLSKGNNFKNLTSCTFVYTFNEHIPIIYWNEENVKNCFVRQKIDKLASAYPIYCSLHDDIIFKDIEKKGTENFKNTYIENLEYAIKSCSFELYHKVLNVKYLADLFKKEPLVFDSRYTKDYCLTVKYMFEVQNNLNRLLDLHKMYIRKGKESKKFSSIIIDIPSDKIEFILSERMSRDDVNVYINVINCPRPKIIISKLEVKKLKEYDWENWLEFILVNSTNIFFSYKFFKELNNKEKTYLFLNHRRIDGLSEEQQRFLDENDKKLSSLIIRKLCNLSL